MLHPFFHGEKPTVSWSMNIPNFQHHSSHQLLIEGFGAHQPRVHQPAALGPGGHVDPVDAARLGAAVDGGDDLLRHAVPFGRRRKWSNRCNQLVVEIFDSHPWLYPPKSVPIHSLEGNHWTIWPSKDGASRYNFTPKSCRVRDLNHLCAFLHKWLWIENTLLFQAVLENGCSSLIIHPPWMALCYWPPSWTQKIFLRQATPLDQRCILPPEGSPPPRHPRIHPKAPEPHRWSPQQSVPDHQAEACRLQPSLFKVLPNNHLEVPSGVIKRGYPEKPRRIVVKKIRFYCIFWDLFGGSICKCKIPDLSCSTSSQVFSCSARCSWRLLGPEASSKSAARCRLATSTAWADGGGRGWNIHRPWLFQVPKYS